MIHRASTALHAGLRRYRGKQLRWTRQWVFGLPVVVTSQAAEGMYLVDGESALIADEPADFAAAIVRLHGDEALWTRLSAGGLQVMEQHFSFAAARRAIEEVVGG